MLGIVDDCIEFVFARVHVDSQAYIVGVVYCPPNSNVMDFNSSMHDVLEKVTQYPYYIMDDFNLDLLKHDKHLPTEKILDVMYANSFIPTINRPTRVTKYTCTIIDNIYTLLAKKGCYTPIEDHKTNVDRTFVFPLGWNWHDMDPWLFPNEIRHYLGQTFNARSSQTGIVKLRNHSIGGRSPADCQPPSSWFGVGAEVVEPDSGPLAACHLQWWVQIPTLPGIWQA